METETALDVLSRAASLLDQGTLRESSTGLARQENPIGGSTDLPQRGIKLRRKERRGQDYLPTKLRTKSRTAGTQTSVSLMQMSIEDDTEDEWVSPVDPRDLQDSDTNTEEDDCDSPLDMTTTNRKSSFCDSEGPKNLTVSSSSSQQMKTSIVQQRPSVITCASTLFEHKRRDLRFISNSANGESTSSNSNNNNNARTCRKTEEFRHGHRREILSGMCDPVIDEHFRRSLGKDYSEVFSGTQVTNTVTVSGLSVDDHFAKALGETWLRLQGKLDSSESNSSATKGSSTPLQATAPAAVQSQRNVLNTQKSLA